ncbi:MAG: hypothetical protein IKF42_01625 [Mogibacterium sp.]|nr:hypothetical protein [Mogibacterium sp.]
MRYLLASIAIAAAAAVYGLFSHGVYSYYMTYAFMIPLLVGAMPHLLTALKASDPNRDGSSCECGACAEGNEPSVTSGAFGIKDVQLAITATLTAGSLMKGALDIYGTTNRLLIAYPVMAVLILAAALTVFIKRREGPVRIFSKKI